MKQSTLIAVFLAILMFCLTLGLAACNVLSGGTDPEGGTQTDGGTTKPDGGTTTPDGGTTKPDGGAEDGTHVHDWGDWTVTKAATCTEAGEETRT